MSCKTIIKILNGCLIIPVLGLFILTICLSVFNNNLPKGFVLTDESLTPDTIKENFNMMGQNTVNIKTRNNKMCIWWNDATMTEYKNENSIYVNLNDIKGINNCPIVIISKADIFTDTFIDIVPTMFGTSEISTTKGISATLCVIASISLFTTLALANKDFIVGVSEVFINLIRNNADGSVNVDDVVNDVGDGAVNDVVNNNDKINKNEIPITIN